MPRARSGRKSARWRSTPISAGSRTASAAAGKNKRSTAAGRIHMRIRLTFAVLAGALALHGMLPANAVEIRLARQFSMGYLQLNVMEHQQLIEKHAKALGLNDVK